MTTKKKGSSKRSAGKATSKAGAKASPAAPVDPRASVQPTAALLEQTLAELTAILAELPVPAEPQPGDLVNAAMHRVLGEGLTCSMAEVAVQRLDAEFVDRNELRVTEAFETEEMLEPLAIPELFDRCQTLQLMVGQIYNDQNRIDLSALRTLTITERKGMFQRLPAMPPGVIAYLNQILTFEDVVFAPRSAARSQARLGLEGAAAEEFVAKARELFQPFGHFPLAVGAPGTDPAKRPLCPTCLLARIQGEAKS